MQTHAEAISPTVTAVRTALAAETDVTDLLSGGSASLFEGEAAFTTAAGEPLPSFVVLTSPAGESDDVFMKRGAQVRCTLDLWCDSQSKVTDLYAAIGKVIDGPTLTISSFAHISGLTRLLATIRDPGRSHLYHGVVQYEALVR